MMGINRFRLANVAEFTARRSIEVLLLILLAAGLCSTLLAVAKPFWYDEICTVIVCRLPTVTDIWKALGDAADTNPPAFYLVARFARQVLPEDHLGYRLPSILGLLGTISCIYFILSRRVDRLSALVGATFVLCTQLGFYAYEARPYALMICCVSCAILAWQRIEDSRLYTVAMGISLAAALSLHYYAILVWPAFIVAETSVWIFRRRFRVSAWASFAVSALPLLFFAKLLGGLRHYYGHHFWVHASLKQIVSDYGPLLNLSLAWGWTFAAGITGIFLYFGVVKTAATGRSSQNQAEESPLPIGEHALILTLLWMPLIAIAVAEVSHIGSAPRYMLPSVLGGALALGYVISKVPNTARMLLLVLFLMNYSLSSVGYFVQDVQRGSPGWSLFGARKTASSEVETVVSKFTESDLPVVSSGILYLPMEYYTPAELSGRLYAIADPPSAVTYLKTDSVDLALLVLRRYSPLQVEDYAGFVSRHREFLLISGGALNWWPARLAHDGDTLKLVSAGEPTVYKVTVRP